MIKSLEPYECVVVIADPLYNEVFAKSWYTRFGTEISFIMIYVEESEDLLSPYSHTQESLLTAKKVGCQLYITLVANGIQVARLLRFGDRFRILNSLAKYIFLYDDRLFEEKLFYLWRKIINVVFIRRFEGKSTANGKKRSPWFELSTVPFPSQIHRVLVPKRLDIWTHSKFRKDTDLFRDKTLDLNNQTVKVVAFPHLPGTAKISSTSTARAFLSLKENAPACFSGTEIEIIQTVAKAMNFRCEIYEPENADVELWGRKMVGGIYTGIIGEMVNARADIALGDLYYTPYLLELMDLSVPYNTECLTFLTPESLTDNSWKTLVLPFKPIMWAAVLICLMLCTLAFYFLARFHVHMTTMTNKRVKNKNRIHPDPVEELRGKKKKVVTLSLFPEVEKLDPNVKYTLMKEQYQPPRDKDEPVGLYQFSQPVNSTLYTYSMLLLVSLPKLPSGWSLRMLTGWYWLYCLLLVTSYRASMTAILAKPTPRVRIDTLDELVASKLTYGGWGDLTREFFTSSDDATLKMISENFVMVNDSDEAVDQVADASFAFYENTYFLKEALVKRQLRFQSLSKRNFTSNQTEEAKNLAKQDRSLHIMNDCIINMPISIGLQKNSPMKPRFDKFIRMVMEAGLIKKWLDDVMQNVLNAEVQTDNEHEIKAIMNMKKFSGGLVALGIGYFISIVTLLVEIIYFNSVVKKNPSFNKYSKTVQNNKKSK
ncbi:glutamate receptor ionotropic, kainate 5 [Anoplophora glabripennis]|uniref:glutamate receptor ionotropic, kainate 5 n=1 Tax=Anoplophora glabripennis TaxID=217634 RepID=UPI000874AC0B|nr:glutamate receptor ionotropic, kainate 5 [Anoplophora glabripennis]